MAFVQCQRHVLRKVEARRFLSTPQERTENCARTLGCGRLGLVRPSAALLPFSLMVMAIMTVPTLVLDEQGLPRYRHLREELGELRESNQDLVREIATLKGEIEALRTDSAYVERIARDELGMVRAEEFVFQFPPR